MLPAGPDFGHLAGLFIWGHHDQRLLAEGYPPIDLAGELIMAIKTEHVGAKNGGGYWGKRAEAKRRCRRLRRKEDRKSIRRGIGESGVETRKSIHSCFQSVGEHAGDRA